MCFDQYGAILVNTKPLKWVDQFKYFGSNISSTESDINIRFGNSRTAIDRLTTIWNSDLSDKIKREFFQAVIVSVLLYRSTTYIHTEKNLNRKYPAASCFEQILEAEHRKTIVVQQLTSHLTNHPSWTTKTCWASLMK